MKAARQLPTDHVQRVAHLVDQSWLILKSRFLQGRHGIPLEAPFQHYFANILSAYLQLLAQKLKDPKFRKIKGSCPKFSGCRGGHVEEHSAQKILIRYASRLAKNVAHRPARVCGLLF